MNSIRTNSFPLPIALLTCVLLSACSIDGVKQEPTGEWVAIPLAQCWSSPWQQQWMNNPANKEQTYPKGLPEEYKIINRYYDDRIVVSDSAISTETLVTCSACGCPSGETLFLYVRDQDVETMLKNGFKRQAPEDK